MKCNFLPNLITLLRYILPAWENLGVQFRWYETLFKLKF